MYEGLSPTPLGTLPVALRPGETPSASSSSARLMGSGTYVDFVRLTVLRDDSVGRWQGENAGQFYNGDWHFHVSASVASTGPLDGCEEHTMGARLLLSCPIPAATSDPPEVDRYTITVSIDPVTPVDGGLYERMGPEWVQRVELGFSEGSMAGTTSVRTTLEVPRGASRAEAAAAVIVWLDYPGKPDLTRWMAGETLFTLRARRRIGVDSGRRRWSSQVGH